MRVNITKAYGEKRVFENLELQFAENEITCILGASGVGKTTLLRILSGLTDYTGEIENLPKNVGYVFQEPRLLPHLTVEQNLLYVGGRYALIEELLQKTEMTSHKDKYPKQLSGGEKQRVAFARAFVCEPDLLLMDEPFSSLDTALKIRQMQAFVHLWEEKKPTTVFVTHDIEEAWALGHRIMILKDGKVILDISPKRTAFPSPYGENSEEKTRVLQTLLQV